MSENSALETNRSRYSELAAKFIASTYELEHLGLDVKSRSNSHEISALCPFHGESRPSFYVNRHSGAFFCHGCQRKGTLPELVSRLTGDSVELCSYKIYRGFVNPARHKPVRNERYFKDLLYKIKYEKNPHDEFKIERKRASFENIIKARNGLISEESINRFGLKEVGASIFGGNNFCIEIPANMHGNNLSDLEMNLVQYRIIESENNLDKDRKYYNMFQKKVALFNMSGMMKVKNKDKPIFVTEGAFDAIRIMESIGYDKPVVSCYSANMSEEQVAMLLAVSKNIVMCIDKDEAADKGYRSIESMTKDVECISLCRAKPISKDFGCENIETIKQILKEHI